MSDSIDYQAAFMALLGETVLTCRVLHAETIPAQEARGRAMSKLAMAIQAAQETAGLPILKPDTFRPPGPIVSDDGPRRVFMSPALGAAYQGRAPGSPSKDEAAIAVKNFRECFPNVAAYYDEFIQARDNEQQGVPGYPREEEDQFEL